MLVLGIECTCDDAGCAIVRDGCEILSNVVSSQVDLHKMYGGVIPELACRRHVDTLLLVIEEALRIAEVSFSDIDLIAVAQGPGLIGALFIGLAVAKALSVAYQIPFIGVNHIEAHFYAAYMSSKTTSFPALGVVLSGGHTSLFLIKELGFYEKIGETVDDAIGEAFDKVAKMLNLPYPGGPEIEKLALLGNKKRFSFKGGRIKNKNFDFSFSGLKTAVLYQIAREKQMAEDHILSLETKRDIAASFQESALTYTVNKVIQAAHTYQVTTILLGGGVTHNRRLRELFTLTDATLDYRWPGEGLSLDNGAMIAGLAYHKYQFQKKGDSLNLEPSLHASL